MMERGDGSFVPRVTRSFNLSRLRFLRELRPLMPERSEWLRVMSYSLLCEAIPPEIEKRDRLNKADRMSEGLEAGTWMCLQVPEQDPRSERTVPLTHCNFSS